MSRALRLVMTFAAALCAWLWAGAAEAAQSAEVSETSKAHPSESPVAQRFEAPRCDGRGATTFAEAPTMQPLLRSLEVLGEDPCAADDQSDLCAEGHRRTPAPERVVADPVLPSPLPTLVASSWQPHEGLVGLVPATIDAAPSHVLSLDRPPRS